MAAGSQTELIDEHVSANQCKLAVDALLTHEVKRQAEQQESQLLPGKEQTIWLGVTLKQMHAEKKLKPHRIPVAFPIVDPRSSSVCLITKDPQREYKDLLEEKKIRFISRVVGVEKLKGKFKGFEERRMLLKENDLFLADERVIPLLPKLLGSKFFVAKKQPIPVCLTRKDLKGELERAISSTYYHQNQGTSASIKIGTLSQPAGHILDNLKTALPALAKVINGGWSNIQSLGIKTGTSANLPIWTCELGPAEGGRWDGMVDVEMADSEKAAAEDDDAPEVVEDAKPTRETRSKGKKRAAEEDEEKEKPKKKAKSSAEDSIPTKKAKDVPVPEVDASTVSETPISAPKAKRRKEKKSAAEVPSEATPAVPAPTPAASSSAAAEVSAPSAATGDRKERRKKRKNAAAGNEDPSSAAPSSETPAGTTVTTADATPHVEAAPSEPQAEQPKKRKPRASAKKAAAAAAAASALDASAPSAADPAPSAPVAAPAPVTPRTKKPRASAADFFDKDDADTPAAAAQATPAPVAPPPNTPARKKRTKRVEETPVSKAIEKLAEGAKGEDAASEAQAQQPEAENAKPKKERKKARKGAAAAELEAAPAADEPKATPTEAAPSVTVQEVKAKRSSSGAEKKKDKALKAKRSATKDALLVKKKGL